MSLYLGKDSSNKKILHIAKGFQSETSLKSGITNSTIFHSSLPYIEYEEIPCTFSLLSNKTIVTLSSTDAESIKVNGYSYFFVVNGALYSTNVYVQNGSVGFNVYGLWSSNVYSTDLNNYYSTVPSSTFNKFILLGNFSTVKTYIVPNIKFNSYIEKTPINNNIQLDSNNFIINGTNLRTYNYINRGAINTTDPTFTALGDTYQFIDGSTGSKIYISSNSTRTYISSDNKPIFDTNGEGKIQVISSGNNSFPQVSLGFAETTVYKTIPININSNSSVFITLRSAADQVGGDIGGMFIPPDGVERLLYEFYYYIPIPATFRERIYVTATTSLVTFKQYVSNVSDATFTAYSRNLNAIALG